MFCGQQLSSSSCSCVNACFSGSRDAKHTAQIGLQLCYSQDTKHNTNRGMASSYVAVRSHICVHRL